METLDQHKVSLITGGEGGIAQAIMEELRGEGRVLQPGRGEMDVTDEASVSQYFSSIERLDLLVCNAGMTDDGLLLKMSESSWDKALEVNLKGAFLCAKHAAARMVKQKRGHIIFIGSYSGFHPHLGQANYAAAKAGLVGLTKSLAQELGGRGVRVNLVVPGWSETKMTEAVTQVKKDEVLAAHNLKKFNTVKNTASFIHHLDTKMNYTSGQVFHLDSRILP